MSVSVPGILFVTQWHYNDALVQAYTLPYIRIIKKITSAHCYLVTTEENNNRVHIKKRGEVALMVLPGSSGFFPFRWLLNMCILERIIRKKHIPVIHSWCTPAGSIGLLLKLMKRERKLIIDSFEPHAEAMAENKTWSRGGLKYRILSYFEKMEAKYADNLIFAAQGMDKYILTTYQVKINHYYIKPACVNLDVFSKYAVKDRQLLLKSGLEDKIVCVYAGKFGGIYLEEEVFAFIKECETYWGKEKFRFLLLTNETDTYINSKCTLLNIQRSTICKLFVPHKEVQLYLGLADFAICPVKPVPTKRYCSPIKNGEYWAMGLPVVIPPGISADSDIIKEHYAGAILEGFSKEDYIKAIEQVDAIMNNKSRGDVYAMIRPLAEKYRNFSIAENVYSQIYSNS